MERFKYIQVQDSQGEYGDSIPFEIDSQNAIMGDNQNLQEDYEIIQRDIAAKVDKVEGKGLSTNDYTTIEKNKLANIEPEANKVLIDTTLSQSGLAADAAAVRTLIQELRSQMVETPPIVVHNPEEMINTNKIYVYMGENSENNEWENGCWYYYGKNIQGIQQWLKGGTYSQASSLNSLRNEINQVKQDLEDYTDQTLEESAATINNYVNTFNTTAENLTNRVVEAERKVEVVDNINQMAQDITTLQDYAMNDFVVHGQVDQDTKVARFVNKNNVVMFTISGIGGDGGGDIIIDPSMQDDDAATAAQKAAVAAAQAKDQAQIYKESAERWATGSTGGVGSATNNAKYWSNLSQSYAKGNLNPHIRQGEETDNAEYYSIQAAASAQEARTALTTQKQLAKAWAVGPDSQSIDDEQPSATNNAKYWATEGVEKYIKSWTIGQQGIRDDEDTNNLMTWTTIAKQWAVGNGAASTTDVPDGRNWFSARQYAEQMQQKIDTIDANSIKRPNTNITIEQSLVDIETNKVDQLESKFKLDIDNDNNDQALYNLMVSLNWWDDIAITE